MGSGEALLTEGATTRSSGSCPGGPTSARASPCCATSETTRHSRSWPASTCATPSSAGWRPSSTCRSSRKRLRSSFAAVRCRIGSAPERGRFSWPGASPLFVGPSSVQCGAPWQARGPAPRMRSLAARRQRPPEGASQAPTPGALRARSCRWRCDPARSGSEARSPSGLRRDAAGDEGPHSAGTGSHRLGCERCRDPVVLGPRPNDP